MADIVTFAGLIRLAISEAAAAPDSDAAGKRYERLLVDMFEAIGCLVRPNMTNYFGAGQIDLGVANRQSIPGLPAQFLVECKNYMDPVDSKAVGYFLFLALSRKAELAVVVAASGLTGDINDSTYAHSLAMSASAMGCKVILLTNNDLLSFATEADFVDMLERRYLAAWTGAGIGQG
jgi:hypothetical protein